MEFIVVDDKNKPINFIDWEITSKLLLEELLKKVPDAVKDWSISPELDACQIEVKNSWPNNLASAIREIIDLYQEVEKVVTNFWFRLLDWWVPHQDFDPVCSYLKPHYWKISDFLLSHSKLARKWTNIAWIHFHIDADENFSFFIKLSNYIRQAILNNDLGAIFMSKERYYLMSKVVEALSNWNFFEINNKFTKTIIPFSFKNKEEVEKMCFKNWEIVWNYSLVGIKKPSWIQNTVEFRAADTVAWSKEKIQKYLQVIGDLLFSL